ncbi:hypothetical protein [Chitinophaga lutea]|nr:hypothetical protein [Chitinophaga lutea]
MRRFAHLMHLYMQTWMKVKIFCDGGGYVPAHLFQLEAGFG